MCYIKFIMILHQHKVIFARKHKVVFAKPWKQKFMIIIKNNSIEHKRRKFWVVKGGSEFN